MKGNFREISFPENFDNNPIRHTDKKGPRSAIPIQDAHKSVQSKQIYYWPALSVIYLNMYITPSPSAFFSFYPLCLLPLDPYFVAPGFPLTSLLYENNPLIHFSPIFLIQIFVLHIYRDQ